MAGADAAEERTERRHDGGEHPLLVIRPPDAAPGAIWTLGRRLGEGVVGFLNWLLTHFSSPIAMSAVIGLLVYAYLNQGAVRILPFEGEPNGTALAVRLGQMLDAVDHGARTGLDEGLDGFTLTTTKPPEVTIPGTGISLTPLVGWAEIHVQAQSVAANGGHRLRLQVKGRGISEQIETDEKATPDEAMTEGAERLYALIVPVNGAYYYFSRYPDRALELLPRLLDDAHPSLAVYRVWGLALRNLGDFDGALDALGKAYERAGSPGQRAHLLVEMGYVAQAARRWDLAIALFEKASKQDPAWPVPIVRRADTLREMGDFAGALGGYEHGGAIKPSFAEAWVGIGRVHAAQGRGELAIVAYETARRFAFDRRQRASLLRDIGDLLFALGCYDGAAQRYAEAMGVAATYDGDRTKRPGRSCPSGSPGGRAEAPGCIGYGPVPIG